MKIVKKLLKWLLFILLIPISYLIISLILSAITINSKTSNNDLSKSIYLSTNGVHLDIILPEKDIDSMLLSGIKYENLEKYISFGWGDENFYINTLTWGDLTFNNAFKAMFLKSSTLMHVTRYKQKHSDWVEIKINEIELQKLNTYLLNTFERNEKGMKILLKNKGYSSKDDFYKSKGSYSCFKTCNSWVNTGFKESGLKSCLWTPFDFGLLNKYQ
ncbi:DUF2459 domain-containing protein [Aquimarina sp. MMG015]|uniref:DUF2459 domain-containing protein n=1 Tax=Aquimarina sp. MMG015 TaxID=2822689 RepID=UPI001B3A163F|nr:DUF2459 domain-containing protein [Aquimarina sp. MMG015]MBQ4804158.1 DUF2459 domain-containing protein [Aquimarina sp. MMG015]